MDGEREIVVISLTAEERRQLQGISTGTEQEPKRARQRATAILMSSEGMSVSKISRALGMPIRTVHEARRRWRRQGFDGLYDAERSGPPPKVTPLYLKLLVKVVQTDPRKLGFAFSRWTCPKLAEYMYQQTQIQICSDYMGQLLKAHGFVWRKAKLTIRNLQSPRGKKTGSEVAPAAAEGLA
jgi:transposase